MEQPCPSGQAIGVRSQPRMFGGAFRSEPRCPTGLLGGSHIRKRWIPGVSPAAVWGPALGLMCTCSIKRWHTHRTRKVATRREENLLVHARLFSKRDLRRRAPPKQEKGYAIAAAMRGAARSDLLFTVTGLTNSYPIPFKGAHLLPLSTSAYAGTNSP